MVTKETNDKKKISGLLEDLSLLENYARELFSFSPMPLCFVSPLGVILEANPAFEEISGYSIYEIIGEPIEDFFDKEKSLFISACDYGLVWDEEKFLQMANDQNIDCLVWTFRNYPGDNSKPEMYSWVQEENGLVKEIRLKKSVSQTPQKDPGIVGAFWFKKAGDFIASAKEFVSSPKPPSGEFHLEGCIDYLIKQGKKAAVFDVGRFVCWGTPNDLKTWEYWKSYFSKKNLIKEA